jgi:esterase/lipase superfamily enzyme
MRQSREFFICQQGFAVPNANPNLYSALMLQPRAIGGLVALGSILQRPDVFFLLAGVMALATIAPALNLFDALYNYAVAYPRGYPPLVGSPAPRRFSQGGAAVLAFAIGLALLSGATVVASILEGAALISIASVVGRRFCVPAHLYYVLRRASAPLFGTSANSASPRC